MNWAIAAKDNKYNGPERREHERREVEDRRVTIRFGDILGRRSGVERRLGHNSSKSS